MASTRLAIFTLISIGLVSARDLLRVSNPGANCGMLGEACCQEEHRMDAAIYETCGGPDSRLVCLNERCVACGKVDTPICENGPHPCDNNLSITPDKMCVCGGVYETCCGGVGGTCDSGLICHLDGQCQLCGDRWQTCCDGDDSKCVMDYICDAKQQCQKPGDMTDQPADSFTESPIDDGPVECGEENEPICKTEPYCAPHLDIRNDMCVCGGMHEPCCGGVDGTCKGDGLACKTDSISGDAKCWPCGDEYQTCCGGDDGACLMDYNCESGQCKPPRPCGGEWQPCCDGVDGTCLDGHTCGARGQCQPDALPDGPAGNDPADEPDDENAAEWTPVEPPVHSKQISESGGSREEGVECGAENEPICGFEPVCDPNLDIDNNRCVCGGVFEVCCGGVDGRCDDGLDCKRDTLSGAAQCQPCGDEYQTCCGGDDGTCMMDFLCDRGQCIPLPPCGDEYQPCCGASGNRTCIDGNACDSVGQCQPNSTQISPSQDTQQEDSDNEDADPVLGGVERVQGSGLPAGDSAGAEGALQNTTGTGPLIDLSTEDETDLTADAPTDAEEDMDVACGETYQPCCAGTCAIFHVCEDGECQPCGGASPPCLSSTSGVGAPAGGVHWLACLGLAVGSAVFLPLA